MAPTPSGSRAWITAAERWATRCVCCTRRYSTDGPAVFAAGGNLPLRGRTNRLPVTPGVCHDHRVASKLHGELRVRVGPVGSQYVVTDTAGEVLAGPFDGRDMAAASPTPSAFKSGVNVRVDPVEERPGRTAVIAESSAGWGFPS